jgi:hypothetical protein
MHAACRLEKFTTIPLSFRPNEKTALLRAARFTVILHEWTIVRSHARRARFWQWRFPYAGRGAGTRPLLSRNRLHSSLPARWKPKGRGSARSGNGYGR